MMRSLENNLNALRLAIMTFDRTANAPNRAAVRSCVTAFEASLRDNAPAVEGFIVSYDNVLTSLYVTCQTRQMRGESFARHLKSLLEQLIDTSDSISKMFAEFVRGITYFGNEMNFIINRKPRPIYHRSMCCGPADAPEIQNVECCVIERKIYDEIWRKFGLHFPKLSTAPDYYAPAQDIGHTYFLNLVEQLWKAQNPDIALLQVTVHSHESIPIPVSVKIVKTYTNKRIVTEEYTKELISNQYLNYLYEPCVKCKKTDSMKSRTFHKVQTFEDPKQWRDSGLGGRSKNVGLQTNPS